MEENEELKKELAETENKLRDCEERFKILSENTEMPIYIIQGEHFVYVNHGMEKATGFSQKELLAMSFWEIVHSEHQEMVKKRGALRQEGRKIPLRYGFKVKTKSGEERWIDAINNAIVFKGSPATLGIAMDITRLKRAEESLRFKNLILKTQQESAIDGILVVDEKGKILSHNQQFIKIWGIPSNVMESKSAEHTLQFVMDKLINPEEFIHTVKRLYKTRDEVCRDEVMLKDGRSLDRYSAPMIDTNDKYYGRVWYFRDITKEKIAEEDLKKISFRDQLTGLYNRFYFEEEKKRLEIGRHFPVCVMFIDVDNLRIVNNNYGHEAGDRLLLRTAKVLLTVFRPEDCIARTGGDEFIILLPGVDEESAKKTKERMEEFLSKHNLSYPLFPLSLSSGIAIGQKGDLLDDIIRLADQRMYAEKKKKKESK